MEPNEGMIMLKSKRVLAAAGAVALAAGIAAAAAAGPADASVGPPGVTATTVLHAYPDAGYATHWANDSITRVATVTLGAPVTPVTLCGFAATTCFSYTGTIVDAGTAYGVTGATSPGAQAIAITGTPSAVMVGGGDVTFDDSSDAPNAALVPTAVNGSNLSTANWVRQFFPEGSTGTAPVLSNWGWTYTDPATCEYFVYAFDVTRIDSGDITGVSHCPVAPLAPSPVTATASSPHLTVAWPAVTGASVYEIDVTGPSGGLKADPVVTATQGMFSIATTGKSGYAKVRAGTENAWDGKTWIAWSPYSATQTWKF